MLGTNCGKCNIGKDDITRCIADISLKFESGSPNLSIICNMLQRHGTVKLQEQQCSDTGKILMRSSPHL